MHRFFHRPPNPDFVDHVAEVLTALSAFDAHAPNRVHQRASLEVFSIPKLASIRRVFQGGFQTVWWQAVI